MTNQGGAEGQQAEVESWVRRLEGAPGKSEHFCRAEDQEARDRSSTMGGAEGLDRTSKDDGALEKC